MATVYFCNNFDSGDGSFRDTLTNSSPGDTIAPDPSVDWGGETITIALSSPIVWGNRSRTVTGGQNHRIRFDGQGTVNHINFSSSNTITFERCDFVRGYRETFGAMFQATNASPTIVFRDCLFAGNKSNGDSAAYNLSSNSSSYKYDVTAINCVIAGDAQAFVTSVRATSVVFTNCTFVKNLSSPSAGEIVRYSNCIRYLNSDDSDIGFVNVPTTVYNADTWTANLWQNWDARLKPGSQYLTGYNGEETADFLGHARKPNGALGAYEGSWIVAPSDEETRVVNSTQADYLELQDDSTLIIEAEDGVITIEEEAAIGASSVEGPSGSWAFLSVPPETVPSEDAQFDRADVVLSSAGVSAAHASETALTWTASAPTIPVVIQLKTNGVYETIAQASGGSYPGEFEQGAEFRVFDGVNFAFAVVPVPSPNQGEMYVLDAAQVSVGNPDFNVWRLDSLEVVKVQPTHARPYQSASLLARIKDAFVQNEYFLNDGTNVAGVTYTARRKTSKGFSTGWAEVPGHTNVSAPAACVLASLTRSEAWTVDSAGYTFALTPDTSEYPLFPEEGQYQIIVTISPEDENDIVVYFDFNVADGD